MVVGGECLAQAYQRFEALEFTAKTIIQAKQLGEVRYTWPHELALAQQRRLTLEEFIPEPATSEEKESRRLLSEFLQRGCRQRLLISTEGSFSARLEGTRFLITPSGQDRELLSPGDLVLIDGERCEQGKRPSRAAMAHQAIYAKHPGIQAIVFAHPVSATAFSATPAVFDARTIPESYLFLRDTPRVPFGVQYANDGRIAEFVSLTQPAAILENDGVMVAGTSILDAFDRLEVLESTAEALVHSRALGSVVPMSQSVIEELRTAFKF